MRRVLIAVFLIFGFKSLAQQLPQYTQYTFNELLVNPAVTGVESYWDLKAGYRNQWSGLEGSPKTKYITLSLPVGDAYTMGDYGQMNTNADNPMSPAGGRNYEASQDHSGIGLSILSDKTGQINQNHFNFNYAYHIRMADKFNLALGASLGFNNISLSAGEITLANATDPVINQGSNSQWKPEAAVGLWAYGSGFFVGASVQQLIPTTLSFINTAANPTVTSKSYAQYFLTAGFRAHLSDDVTLLPSVMFRPETQGPATYDVNMKVAFSDKFWISGAYRHNDAVAGSFGVNIGGFMSFGYSYDYTSSALNSYTGGTHEIMLGIMLNNNYNVTSPRHTW